MSEDVEITVTAIDLYVHRGETAGTAVRIGSRGRRIIASSGIGSQIPGPLLTDEKARWSRHADLVEMLQAVVARRSLVAAEEI